MPRRPHAALRSVRRPLAVFAGGLALTLGGSASASPDPVGWGLDAANIASLPAFSLGGRLDGDAARYDKTRVDARAPIGLLGDHLVDEGQWLFTVRVTKQRLDGLRDGTNRTDALGFLITPIDMDRNTVLFGGQLAVSEELNLLVTVPWVETELDQSIAITGQRFTTRSKGFGDMTVTGLMQVADHGSMRAHVDLGLSLPTGSIEEEDRTPFTVGADRQLTFVQQLGTGTFDLLPGLAVTGQQGVHSWGARLGGRFHLGENSQGYTRGDRLEATAWWAHQLSESQAATFRLAFADWDEHSDPDDDVPNGAPAAFRVGATPTADPERQGGQRVDFLVGWNSKAPAESEYAGHRIAVEVGVPVRQALSGPQLETDWTLNVAWQKTF